MAWVREPVSETAAALNDRCRVFVQHLSTKALGEP